MGGRDGSREARARPVVRPVARSATGGVSVAPPPGGPQVSIVDDLVPAVVRDVCDPGRDASAVTGRPGGGGSRGRSSSSSSSPRGRCARPTCGRARPSRRGRCHGDRRRSGAAIPILANGVLDALIEAAVCWRKLSAPFGGRSGAADLP